MPEIIETTRRCKECGSATRVLVGDTYMTLDGRMIYAEWCDDVPHTRSDCQRFITLEREQWPTLW